METTKNVMPQFAKEFYARLGNYLDTKVYFYGSIQRADYFPNYSDIDADIFTDNESRTIIQLQNLLGLKRSDFHKFIYKLHATNRVSYGYKVAYTSPENNFITEISIYNEKYKADVLTEHNSKVNLPFYVLYMLIALKFLYYNMGIVPTNTFKYLKRLIINYMVTGQKEAVFIMTDIHTTK